MIFLINYFILFAFGVTSGGLFVYYLLKDKFASNIKILDGSFQLEKQFLQEKISDFDKENLELTKINNELVNENITKNEQIIELRTINDINQSKINEIRLTLASEISEKKSLEKVYLESQCNLFSVNSQNETLQNNLKLINDSLLHQFKNIANEILTKNNIKFSEDSKEKLNNLINPLNHKLQEFQKTMQDCFDIDAKEKFSLKDSIGQVLQSNSQIKDETLKLTNALKSNNIVLGHWGEMILENILISSGLRANCDYELQEKSHTNASRPDAIIKLPNNKSIIIDAKTSYFDTNNFDNLTDEEEKSKFIKGFVKRIRSQIDNLSTKEYHYNCGLNTPELTIMFIPVESWYNIAIQYDSQLYEYGWNKNIAIVSSSTLFVILKTISYIWKGENQEKNAAKIADYAGALYDQFVEFVNSLVDIGKSIKNLSQHYEKTISKLHLGRGNLLKRTEYIKLLGIKHKKVLDKQIIFDMHENIKSLIHYDNEKDKITENTDEIVENAY
jgi:DNA recombination protein RmuC